MRETLHKDYEKKLKNINIAYLIVDISNFQILKQKQKILDLRKI